MLPILLVGAEFLRPFGTIIRTTSKEMIKKLQVIVREVYESEDFDEIVSHRDTGENISTYEFKNLPDEEKKGFVFERIPNGKAKVEISEGDPIFGQIFFENDLNIKDLILHLNRTK